MTKLTAEEFLARVQKSAAENDIHLEDVNFHMPSGMRCSWYAPDEDDDQENLWALTTGAAAN